MFSRPHVIDAPDFVYPTDVASAHLVFCERGMLLTKRRHRHWREIQDAYEDYNASLGPYTRCDLFVYFHHDYGDIEEWPFSPLAIDAFLASGDETLATRER